MPYKISISNEINCQINAAVSNRNKSPDITVIRDSCLMVIFKFVLLLSQLLSDFWLLQKKCLTNDKGDHNTQSFAQQGSSEVNHRLLVCQLSGAWKSSQRAFPFPWPSEGSCAKTLTFSFSILNPSSLLCLPLPFPTWLQAPRSPRIWCLLTAAQVTDVASLFQQKIQVKIEGSFLLHPCSVQHCRYSKGKTSSETGDECKRCKW